MSLEANVRLEMGHRSLKAKAFVDLGEDVSFDLKFSTR